MFTNNVPKHFWGEATLTATYFINRMPSRVLKFQTPRYVLITSYPHILSFSTDLPLKVFGCSSFVHIHHTHRNKLDPKSLKCISLVTHLIKKVINVILPRREEYITPWMSPSLRMNPTFPNPTFRGRIQGNIRFEILFKTLKPVLIHQIPMSPPLFLHLK